MKAYFFSKININNMLNLTCTFTFIIHVLNLFILEFMFSNCTIFICSFTRKLCYFNTREEKC